MIFGLFGLLAASVSSYFAIAGSIKDDVNRFIRSVTDTFEGFFAIIHDSNVDVDEIAKLIGPSGVDVPQTPPLVGLPLGVVRVLPSNSVPDVAAHERLNKSRAARYRYPLNHQNDVTAGATLITRGESGRKLFLQKKIWAWNAPKSTAALVVGLFEGQDLVDLNDLKRFSLVIGTDLWDSAPQAYWGAPHLRQSAQRFIADNDLVLMGDQQITVPYIVQYLKRYNIPLGFSSVEAATRPDIYIPTALSIFHYMVDGGIMILNTSPHQPSADVPLYEPSPNELLIASTTVLSILRGRYVLLEQSFKNPWYIAVMKVPVKDTGEWNAGSNWYPPFGVTLDSLRGFITPRGFHKLRNTHYLNFLGLGTRWETCDDCGKSVEVDHTRDWERQVNTKMGPCDKSVS